MKTPGFTAEASLQNGGNHYIALRAFGRSDTDALPQWIWERPAFPIICSESCIDNCYGGCDDICADLRGDAHVRCIAGCHGACRRECCHR
jgi:hypothetical protein